MLIDGFKRAGKKPMEREGESLDQEGRILGRKGQDKRKERAKQWRWLK